jgi:ubiquinone/menaquinone biosynthesis C-methylase UbiE
MVSNTPRRCLCAVLLLCSVGLSAHGADDTIELTINPRHSLVRIGMTPQTMTKRGRQLAGTLWAGLASNDVAALRMVVKGYSELETHENVGGDYGALKWLAETLLTPVEDRSARFATPLTTEFYDYFAKNDCEFLKEYLVRRYALNNFAPEDSEAHLERRTFLADFLMFGNPRRHEWESSDEIIQQMPIEKGDKVLDIGCGFGYYSYHFSRAVGPGGQVYAIDIVEPYIDFIRGVADKYRLENIIPVVSRTDDINVQVRADVAFLCSLYHIIHTWSPERDQRAFIASIKRALRPGGYLVIADNSFANGTELHNCYVHRELVQAQLHYHGFTLERCVDITDRRYVMIFRNSPGKLEQLTVPGDGSEGPTCRMHIASGKSIVHIGSLDSYDITEKGIAAARLVRQALETGSAEVARRASAAYEELIPNENFGGEYTALQWFCDYVAASETEREAMISDPFVAAFYNYLGADNYSRLIYYVTHKYKLEGKKLADDSSGDEEDSRPGHTRRAILEDFILFNNPRRGTWEKTEKIMQLVAPQPGETIADIGSGPGFFSVKLADAVGSTGRIYALDIKKEHLDFINEYTAAQGMTNIVTVRSDVDDAKLPGPIDCAYMCSLYHIIYGVSSEPERHAFLTSITKAMRSGGRLVIVDNGPVSDEELPYHGPYISRELIVGQLAHYGFHLESTHQIIPQRYLLDFRLRK